MFVYIRNPGDRFNVTFNFINVVKRRNYPHLQLSGSWLLNYRHLAVAGKREYKVLDILRLFKKKITKIN